MMVLTSIASTVQTSVETVCGCCAQPYKCIHVRRSRDNFFLDGIARLMILKHLVLRKLKSALESNQESHNKINIVRIAGMERRSYKML